MEGSPRINKNILFNRRVFIASLVSLFTTFETHVSDDLPSFFRVQSLNDLWTLKKKGSTFETSVLKAVKRKTSINSLLLKIFFLFILGLPSIKSSVINLPDRLLLIYKYLLNKNK